MASIELKNVTKIYEGFKALDALNLTVPSGSVYGLIGPNGAGKTTAIRHMMGVLRQDAGSVLLDGDRCLKTPRSRRGCSAFRTSRISPPRARRAIL